MEITESILIFLSEMVDRIIKGIDKDQIPVFVTEHIFKNTEANATALYLPGERDSFVLSATYGNNMGYNLKPSFLHDFPELKSGTPVTINLEEDSIFLRHIFPVKKPTTGNLSLIPIIFDRDIKGIIIVLSESDSGLTNEEISWLKILSVITAISIKEKETISKVSFVYHAGSQAASYQEISDMLKIVTDGVCEALKIKGCSIQLFDRHRERLINCVSRGLSHHFLEKGPVSDKYIIARILEGKNIMSTDAARDADSQHREAFISEGIVSTFSVPLVSDNDIIGVLKAYTSSPHRFTIEETAFLETFASYSALIIKNAQRLNRIHSINLLGNIISTMKDPDEIYEMAAQHITEVMNVKGCFIMLFDRNQKNLLVGAYHGLSEEFADYVKIDKENIINLVREGITFQVEDVCNDDRVQFRDLSILEGICSFLSVPLYCEGNITGTIRALASYRHKFSREEEEYLNAISSFISIANDNVLIQNRDSFVRDIIEDINSTPEPDSFIPKILTGLTELTNIKACTLSMFSEKELKLIMKHSCVFDDFTQCSEAYQIIEDVIECPDYLKTKMENGFHSMKIKGSSLELHKPLRTVEDLNQAFFFPVYSKGIMKGVLTLYTAGNQMLSAGELKFSSTLAGLTGICL
ncbi:MAG: GAF domain-containing protein [Firmicutes bacterium]|nr:GAF domain-containing protein [Bacillota bacterium]